jgi:hypothetical protein
MTINRVCNQSNTMGVTCEVGPAYLSGPPKFASKRMELIEVKILVWAQKGKLYIIYENVMWILGILRFKSIHLLLQYSSYCFLASELSIEKKKNLDRQQITTQ